MKSWAARSGLVNDTTLTEAGRIVLAQDPYLQSPITDWFMHFHLSFGSQGLATPPDNPAEWGGWTWFTHEYLPQYPTFTIDELVGYASTVFNESSKQLQKNLNYVLRAYTEPQALGKIQYLTAPESKTYTAANRQLPNPYLMGYCLAQLWQRDFSDVTSILTQDLLNQRLGLTAAFSLSPAQLQETLNDLEYHHILDQQKAVAPPQLIRRWQNPLDLLEKAYTT